MGNTRGVVRPTDLDRSLLVRGVTVMNPSRITVRGLVDRPTSKGLTRYIGSESKRCRWRCEAVTQMLENEGHAEKGTVVDLGRRWFVAAADNPRVPSAKIKG